jgi:hypothetical protein
MRCQILPSASQPAISPRALSLGQAHLNSDERTPAVSAAPYSSSRIDQSDENDFFESSRGGDFRNLRSLLASQIRRASATWYPSRTDSRAAIRIDANEEDDKSLSFKRSSINVSTRSRSLGGRM